MNVSDFYPDGKGGGEAAGSGGSPSPEDKNALLRHGVPKCGEKPAGCRAAFLVRSPAGMRWRRCGRANCSRECRDQFAWRTCLSLRLSFRELPPDFFCTLHPRGQTPRGSFASALAKFFRRHRPKVVIGFGGKTVLASPDHYQAMLITDAAVFYSRLTKWDEHFDGLPVHTVTNQLSFPIALHGLDLPESSGYIVADIGPTLETKLRAVRAYETQFTEKSGIHRAVEVMNRYHGLTAGFEAGEIFMTYRTVGVDDLMRWASPAHAR